MSIQTVRHALNDINLTVKQVAYTYEGTSQRVVRIVSAPDDLPNSLNDADLPAAVVTGSDIEWLHEAFGDQGEAQKCTYNVTVYVAPVAQGADGESYSKGEALLQYMGHLYLHDRENESSIFHDWTIRSAGVRGDLTYAGTSYVGFVIRLLAETWE